MTVAVGRPAGLAAGLMLAAFIVGPPDRLIAQVAGGVATLTGTARSAGLAGAGVALLGDAGSIFTNPAGIATIHRFGLEASYERYPAQTSLASAAAAVRVGRLAYGVAGQMLRPAATPIGSADVLALSALVYRLGMIAVGGALKYVRQGVVGPRTETYAGDVGIAIGLFDILALGASVQNVGGQLGAGAHLPRRTRVGFTMNFVDPQGFMRLRTTLEGQWPEGGPAIAVAGAEGGLVTAGGIGIMARVGVSGAAASSDLSPLALGAGVSLGRFRVDYAYRAYDTPGAIHRVGLRWTR